AVIAEPDDVGAAVPGQVSEKAWIQVDEPSARVRVGFEVGEHPLRRTERAVAVAESDPDAVIAEPDDVRGCCPGHVSEQAWIHVAEPSARVRFGSEVCEHPLRRTERAVPVGDTAPVAVIAEPDDVGAAVPGQVSEKAWIQVDEPSARVRV